MSGSDPAVWIAVCGDRITSDEAEIIGHFTGTPCMTCFMAAALTCDAPIMPAELEIAPAVFLRELPEVSPTEVRVAKTGAMLMYAPSWRERVIHYVNPNEPTANYENGTVVLGICGEIGWGPYGRPPENWPMHDACLSIASKEDF
ncbi:hypothetical protein ACH347_31725 [Saccharopolyspora sp. 5N102]|uniref:hypothetical protein n=1 Tax=Saccharopolyspora sp. 5N102 TaxID=3375155 RepID=UPI00379CDD51